MPCHLQNNFILSSFQTAVVFLWHPYSAWTGQGKITFTGLGGVRRHSHMRTVGTGSGVQTHTNYIFSGRSFFQ